MEPVVFFRTLVEMPTIELQAKYPIDQLTALMEASLKKTPPGNSEVEQRLKFLGDRIASVYKDQGQALVTRIQAFVNTPRNITHFILDIINDQARLPKSFTVPELKELIKANSKVIYELRENVELKSHLCRLADRITNEYTVPQAYVLAAGIRSFVYKMDHPPVKAADKKINTKQEQPISFKAKGCEIAKSAIALAIQEPRSIVDLSDYPDVTDEDLIQLFKENLKVEQLSIKSNHVTLLTGSKSLKVLNALDCEKLEEVSHFPLLEVLDISNCKNFKVIQDLPSLKLLKCDRDSSFSEVPTLKSLLTLYCKECPGLLIRSQPRLEKLFCDAFDIKLEQPVTATFLNSDNYDFYPQETVPSVKKGLFSKKQ